ncbi:cytochrome c biogenesis CcdA family protein [Lysinibacillus sp. NPDC097287]|uniref:cytochrome c biogenesis CcdA family protein n=1 Tax=Lysinibacillus sp. NPDC097287 TaxID=3364144 RepID=UPI0038013D3A
MQTDVNLFFAFGAGLLSFISPCVLPLYPAFLSYITGLTIGEIQEEHMAKRKTAVFHTLSFLLGFSLIYIFLGFSATVLGEFFLNYGELFRQFGAIFMVLFGFMTLGIWKPEFLMKEHRVNIQNRPAGYVGSVVIGFAFAAGWTPCAGPILGAILLMVSQNSGNGMGYMAAYILGFSIPFFTLSFFVSKLAIVKKYSQAFMKVGGVIMIVVGLLLFFDQMTIFNRLLAPIFGDFIGF